MTAAPLAKMPKQVPEWHQLAACKLFDELDFIEPGGPDAKPAERAAAELACLAVCAVCPVRLQCAVGALERRERWGIWGGLDYQARKVVAARHGYEPPGDPPEHGTNARRVKWGCACWDCRRAHAVYEYDRRARARKLKPAVERPQAIALTRPARVEAKPRQTGPSPAVLAFRRRVVELAAQGLTAIEIGALLGVHRNTVGIHLRCARQDSARRPLRLNLAEYDRRRRARSRRR